MRFGTVVIVAALPRLDESEEEEEESEEDDKIKKESAGKVTGLVRRDTKDQEQPTLFFAGEAFSERYGGYM